MAKEKFLDTDKIIESEKNKAYATDAGTGTGSSLPPNETVNENVDIEQTGTDFIDGGDNGTEAPAGDTDGGAGDTGDAGDTGGTGSTTASGTEIPDFVPQEQSADNYNDPDMSATVPTTNDVAVPESNTGLMFGEDKWTVQKQLEELYNRDSPFFETARQNAIRRHLAGGGQNSAMAAAAGEGAAMETAFKVAFADAQTYAAFSQAEQKFIHNALLSDQAYNQARELQTQRIEAQFEAIRLDFKGKSALMDKELDVWLQKAKQEHQYALDMLWENEKAFEGREQRGFQRKMTLEGMLAMSQFYTEGINSVFAATANLKNPTQQAQSLRSGFSLLSNQFDLLQSFWGQWGAGGPTGDYDWLGMTSTDNGMAWWDWSNTGGGTYGGGTDTGGNSK